MLDGSVMRRPMEVTMSLLIGHLLGLLLIPCFLLFAVVAAGGLPADDDDRVTRLHRSTDDD
jgi:hypothetical protein